MSQNQTDLTNASIADLHGSIANCEAISAKVKERMAALQIELNRRLGEQIKAAFDAADKSHGDVTIALADGFSVKANISKRVSWDSDKLMSIARDLPWERVNAIFKVGFSITETNYKGLAAGSPELVDRVNAARTEVFGEPKITLKSAD